MSEGEPCKRGRKRHEQRASMMAHPQPPPRTKKTVKRTKTQTRHSPRTPADGSDECSPAHPDFSRLPMLVWEPIIQTLDNRDRLAVAGTCSTLRALCDQARFWRWLTVSLGNPWVVAKEKVTSEMDPAEKVLLMKYSRHVTDVVLYLYGCLKDVDFDAEYLELLSEACRQWRVRCLHVHPTCPEASVLPLPASCKAILSRLLSVPQPGMLRELTIFWCRKFREGRKSALFELLKAPLAHEGLESLSLYASDDLPWASHLRHEAATFVGRLSALQRLFIHSEFLSDKLLSVLCHLQGLARFTIEYEIWKAYDAGRVPSPKTSEDRWLALTSAHPSMTVHVSINKENSAGCHTLLELLPPPVTPVTSFEIFDLRCEWSRRTVIELILKARRMYLRTLSHVHLSGGSLLPNLGTSFPLLITECLRKGGKSVTFHSYQSSRIKGSVFTVSQRDDGAFVSGTCCVAHMRILARLCQEVNRLHLRHWQKPVPTMQRTNPWMHVFSSEHYRTAGVWSKLQIRFTRSDYV